VVCQDGEFELLFVLMGELNAMGNKKKGVVRWEPPLALEGEWMARF
jgi:hypothetical protein